MDSLTVTALVLGLLVATIPAWPVWRRRRSRDAAWWRDLVVVVCGLGMVVVSVAQALISVEKAAADERRLSTAEQGVQSAGAEVERAQAGLQAIQKRNAPRELSPGQLQGLRDCLSKGPRGEIVVTFLSVETDAVISPLGN
jgi:hypothetical protein